MSKQLPEHLQKILDKEEKKWKEFGLDQSPADFLAECHKKAEKAGDDNALIHGLIE
jgi:hypothetical protein